MSGQENYGKSDAACVAEVKDLYQKLKLEEGGGSLELAGLPGDHHCPMVKHRARFIHYCHCSRSFAVLSSGPIISFSGTS